MFCLFVFDLYTLYTINWTLNKFLNLSINVLYLFSVSLSYLPLHMKISKNRYPSPHKCHFGTFNRVKQTFLEILWKNIGVAVGFGLTVLYSTSNCTVTIYIENCAGVACLTLYLNGSLGTTIVIHHKLSK